MNFWKSSWALMLRQYPRINTSLWEPIKTKMQIGRNIKMVNSISTVHWWWFWNFGSEVDFMDLFLYKGEEFYVSGKLDISFFQKQDNKFMYIQNKSGHQNTLFIISYWENDRDTLDVLHRNSTSFLSKPTFTMPWLSLWLRLF